MTATLTSDGLLLLPPEVREAARKLNRERFDVMTSTSGVIVLRPEQKRKRSLVEHLRSLEGLEFDHRRDPIPDPLPL